MTFPSQTNSDTLRLDRLSALLLAVSPRVSIENTDAPAEDTLWICLKFIQDPVPHSISVHTSSNTDADIAFQVHLEGPAAPLLMREFIQPIKLNLSDTDSALQLAVQVLWAEMKSPRCGQPAMLTHAGNMLFVGLLRHLVAHPAALSGLFSGLSDPRIAKSLVAMHTYPQRKWTLITLAEHAGMSRTLFATQFKSVMDTSPGRYLSEIRLLIAQRAVQMGKGLKKAAIESGYQDSSALSRALQRSREKSNT